MLPDLIYFSQNGEHKPTLSHFAFFAVFLNCKRSIVHRQWLHFGDHLYVNQFVGTSDMFTTLVMIQCRIHSSCPFVVSGI